MHTIQPETQRYTSAGIQLTTRELWFPLAALLAYKPAHTYYQAIPSFNFHSLVKALVFSAFRRRPTVATVSLTHSIQSANSLVPN